MARRVLRFPNALDAGQRLRALGGVEGQLGGRNPHVRLQPAEFLPQDLLQPLPRLAHRGGLQFGLRGRHRDHRPAAVRRPGGSCGDRCDNFQQPAAEDGLGRFRVGQLDGFVEHRPRPKVFHAAELYVQAEFGGQPSGFGLNVAGRMPQRAPCADRQRRRQAPDQKRGTAHPPPRRIVQTQDHGP